MWLLHDAFLFLNLTLLKFLHLLLLFFFFYLSVQSWLTCCLMCLKVCANVALPGRAHRNSCHNPRSGVIFCRMRDRGKQKAPPPKKTRPGVSRKAQKTRQMEKPRQRQKQVSDFLCSFLWFVLLHKRNGIIIVKRLTATMCPWSHGSLFGRERQTSLITNTLSMTCVSSNLNLATTFSHAVWRT